MKYSVPFLLLIISPFASANLTPEQMTLFTQKCAQCHVKPETGAPIIGNVEHWQPVKEQGFKLTLKHVVEGKGSMPPLGSCSACTEDDFRALTQFLAGFTDEEVKK